MDKTKKPLSTESGGTWHHPRDIVSTKLHSHLFTVKANLNETKSNKLRLEQNGENYCVVIIDSCLVNLEVARMGRNH